MSLSPAGRIIALVAVVAIAVTAVVVWQKMRTPAAQPRVASAEVWSCPDHPEVRRFEPGVCPKCNRPLVLVESPAQTGTR